VLADDRERTTDDEFANDRRRRFPMGTRRKSRELALQMLFQADLGQQPIEEVRKTFWQGRGDVAPEVKGFAEDIFRVARDRAPEIDKLIENHAENWRMDRMAAVDRNLMRAAVAELLGFPKTPRAVIINEAIEIARKFSSPESVQFINGVLDSVGKEIESQALASGC
jgi:transcription antitermination protein NusB